MELIEIHRRKLKPGKGVFKGRDNTFTTQTPRQSSILCCNRNLSSRIPLLSLPNEPVQKLTDDKVKKKVYMGGCYILGF